MVCRGLVVVYNEGVVLFTSDEERRLFDLDSPTPFFFRFWTTTAAPLLWRIIGLTDYNETPAVLWHIVEPNATLGAIVMTIPVLMPAR